jgi:hypothetical protein
MSNLPVLNTLVACAAACMCVVAAADKYSLFHKAVDKKYTGHIVETLVAKSARHCSMKCLASSSCMACNWDAATGSCEISTQHATITDAPGIVMYTSKPLSSRYPLSPAATSQTWRTLKMLTHRIWRLDSRDP